MFDINKAFKQSGIGKKKFEKIKIEVRKEFPDNEMLYELHVIRYLESLKKKTASK